MDQINEFCSASRPFLHEYRKGRHRLGYHLMPICGWMNDPHGPVWHQGEYHYFCNVYPYDAEHPFAGKYWAHFTTKNLVDFISLSPAIAPDRPLDRDGCASGCAISHQEKIWLFYTARDRSSTPPENQAVAISSDGRHFDKLGNGTALIAAGQYGNDFRDPYLFRWGERWHMLLGNRKNEQGRVLVYSSDDLLHWNDEGIFCEKAGEYGFMWECPDFIQIGGKDFLIISPEGMPQKRHSTGYFTGKISPSGLRFAADCWYPLDAGRDFYAPQTFFTPDGRTLLVAWMQKWFTDIPTATDNWVGAVTIPRELSPGYDGLLEQRPARELLALRQSEEIYTDVQIVSSYALRATTQFELRLSIDLIASTADTLLLTVGGVVYTLDLRNRRVCADFSASGEAPAPSVEVQLRRTDAALLDLVLFADRSSHEFFAEAGVTTLTHRIYPFEPGLQSDIALTAQGGTVSLPTLVLYQLRDAHMEFAF